MKVLLLGSGAASHALAWKFVSSPRVRELHCVPGNAGTALLLGTLPISPEHVSEIVQWAFSERVDLIVGQRMPAWIEAFTGVGLSVLGAGEREWRALSSRQEIRERLQRYDIPCLRSSAFGDLETAQRYLASRPLPLWIRRDSRFQWGALRLEDRYEAFQELERLLRLTPGAQVCLEEDVPGPEVGLGLLTDGQRAIPFGVSRSYGCRYEGEVGPMTEGMGAYAPYGDHALEERLMALIGRPVVAALAKEGLLRPAFLYLRVILGEEGPLLRDLDWGLDDLHAAVTLPLWGGDLAGVMEWAAQGRLEEGFSSWWPGVTVAVTMVVEGYPSAHSEGYPLPRLYDADILTFHHATRLQAVSTVRPVGPLSPWLRLPVQPGSVELPQQVVTSGGRVLLVVGYASSGAEARRQAYAGVAQQAFQHSAWRRDIAAELE